MKARIVVGAVVLPMLVALAGVQAGNRFPWEDEPYTGDPGTLRQIDPRLVALDGANQDSLSARAVSFLDRVTGPETPHVPYARPWHRGPIRVLYLSVFTWGTDPRVIVELQQRLDADIKRFVLPITPYLEQLTELMLPRYLKLLAADYDVIVYGGDYGAGEQSIDERYLKPLLAKVAKGTGFVYLPGLPTQNPKDLKTLAPILALELQGPNGGGKGAVVCQDHPAVNGIPFDLLQYRRLALNRAAAGARAIASIGKNAFVAAGQYGQGRIVAISNTDALYFGRPETSGIYYRSWEYLFALEARCALWAARHEPETKMKLNLPATVPTGRPLAAEVTVQGDTALLNGSDLKVTWYDDEHQPVDEQRVRLSSAETRTLTCRKPLRAGQVLVEARLLDRQGRAMDWASGGAMVQAPGEAALKIEPEIFRDGQPVQLSVTGWKPAGGQVRFRVTDSYQRLVLDAARADGTATWTAANVRGTIFHVVADVANERGATLLRQRGTATCPRSGIDDYYNYFWPGPYATFNADLVMALYRDCGVDGIYSQPAADAWYTAAANRLKIMGGNLVPCWGWGNVFANPLLSEAVRAEIKARGYDESVKLLRRFGMTWGSLQDEGTVQDDKYGFDEFTLAAFRKDLEARYHTLAALNQQWATNFATWDQVKPAQADEMKGRTSYGQWLEFRHFLDQRAAQQLGEIVAGLKKEGNAPAAPIGVEGIFGFTGHHVPYGLYDYSLLTRAGLSIAPYNGPECFDEGGGDSADSDLDSFLNPQPAPAAWCGYSMPQWQQTMYPWWGAFHGYAGMAYFQAAIYTDSTGAKYPNARWIEEPTRPLRHGVGKLLLTSQRHFDPVAIYFDMDNFYLAWIVAQTQGKGWLQRLVADGKASTERILQHLGATPGYVTPASIAAGALNNYKLVILTGAIGLSQSTLASLQGFVAGGGVVIADGLVGMYDETGRPTAPGFLKDLFGVVRTRADVKMLPGQYSLGVLKRSDLFPSLPFEWMKGTLFEEGLTVDGGLALGGHVEIANAPGFVAKASGHGRALLINAVNTTYLYDGDDRDLNVWQSLLDDAGVVPLVRVCDQGMRLRCYDVKVFTNQNVVLAGVIRSPHFGAINPLDAEVTFAQAGELYDVINGKYLGRGTTARLALLPGRPALVAQLPRRVSAVIVKLDPRVPRGGVASFELGLDPAVSLGTVLRLEVYRPDGQLDEALSGNLVARDSRAAGVLPIALNDPPGEWKLKVREVITHQATEATFRVR